MRIRYIITLITILFSGSALAQDSLAVAGNDSLSQRLSVLFTPLTFYHAPAHDLLSIDGPRDSVSAVIDRTLMNVYLKRPDLVRTDERRLDAVGAPIVSGDEAQQSHPDIVEQVAPVALEPEIKPMGVYVKRPNFWSFGGDYYLQFLQSYISGNWYKGGESNYSMLGSITMLANYNNKQKVKWENKLEMKLGYATSKGDSVHSLKTNEDLIRLTSKLGLQATKHWYYTVQLVGETQFTHGYKSNDRKVYSDFLSPFKLNLSLGMDYNVSWMKNRLTGSFHLAPIAFNWKFVDRIELATNYGVDEGKHSLIDYGSEVTVDLTWKILENLRWRTRLWAYTTYERTEMEWENTFSFQFNKWISTNIFIYPRFDDGVGRDEHHGYWQFKEYASVGFSYSF